MADKAPYAAIHELATGCKDFKPDHNGECLNCDEPLSDAVVDAFLTTQIDMDDPARVARIRALVRKKLNEDKPMADDDPKLAPGDLALIQSALTGEGAVPVTPEMLDQIGKDIRARQADIEARYPALVEACPYETKLAVVAWVFEALVAHATEGGTYRYLIYHRLGFKPDAYLPLYNAGGMTISNEFDLKAPHKETAE